MRFPLSRTNFQVNVLNFSFRSLSLTFTGHSLDWIANLMTKAVSTVFHSLILHVVQFVIETGLQGYTENINEEINNILRDTKGIETNYNYYSINSLNEILKT